MRCSPFLDKSAASFRQVCEISQRISALSQQKAGMAAVVYEIRVGTLPEEKQVALADFHWKSTRVVLGSNVDLLSGFSTKYFDNADAVERSGNSSRI